MALITTVGGSTSDSYVTKAEADTYFTSHPKSAAWTAVGSDTNKEILLKRAAQHLNLLHYWGIVVYTSQALKFPRLYKSAWMLPASIPQNIKNAQMEHALELAPLLSSGGEVDKREQLQQQGVTSFSLGDLSEKYNDKYVEQVSKFSQNPLLLFGNDSRIFLYGAIKRTFANYKTCRIEDSNYTYNCDC